MAKETTYLSGKLDLLFPTKRFFITLTNVDSSQVSGIL